MQKVNTVLSERGNRVDRNFNLIEYLTVKREEVVLIWLCNIGAEKYWNNVSSGVIDRIEDIVARGMEEINLLLCRRQDILIMREPPADDFIGTLRELGFSIPRIICPKRNEPQRSISELVLSDEQLADELREIAGSTKDVYFVPYAVTNLEEQIAQKCKLTLIGPSSEMGKLINNKIYCREMAQELGLAVSDGRICRSLDEIRETYSRLTRKSRFEKVIIKEPFGASGKGLYLIANGNLLEPTLTVLSRFNKKTGNSIWLVEGWYKKLADINYQIYISPSGQLDLFSIKKQLLNGVVYVGSKLGSVILDSKVKQEYMEFADRIGDYLFHAGYTGIVSIDSIITETGNIIPMVEINGRFSLSTYLSFVGNIFGDKQFLSLYYKVKAENSVRFSDIHNAIGELGLAYQRENGEGVIVLSSATLPRKRDDYEEILAGRMFVLILSSTDERIQMIKSKFEEAISQLFCSIY